ncbi:hypothetical protein JW613_24600 [Streptomyces smyrnaeus]|uniref:Uncharacterized protein n=1 Tax=Streptomyces smyrnaeus TaxID=1387713 RepID=A0ABS3Y1H9_9ACTN|nr:hypothetical protein [Streptomyces smyrnaeus]MBO8201451.1 hypothetical protein [Streptomyces smyrnaeus]
MRLLDRTEMKLTVDYGTFGIVDMAPVPDAHGLVASAEGSWLRTRRGMAYPDLVSNVAFIRLRLENWGPGGPGTEPPLEGDLARVDEADVEMPSGVLGIEVIAAGLDEEVFSLPGPGQYRIRVAFCVAPDVDPVPLRKSHAPIERAWQGREKELEDVDEFFLVQFWSVEDIKNNG